MILYVLIIDTAYDRINNFYDFIVYEAFSLGWITPIFIPIDRDKYETNWQIFIICKQKTVYFLI